MIFDPRTGIPADLDAQIGADTDPNQLDAFGRTAIHRLLYAIRPPSSQMEATLEKLLHRGADLEIPDRNGLTPLLFFLKGSDSENLTPNLEVVQLMIQHGANIHATHPNTGDGASEILLWYCSPSVGCSSTAKRLDILEYLILAGLHPDRSGINSGLNRIRRVPAWRRPIFEALMDASDRRLDSDPKTIQSVRFAVYFRGTLMEILLPLI